MNLDDNVTAWERQPDETLKQFHAFAHYRDLPPGERSQDRAHRDHQVKCLHVAQVTAKRRSKRWAEWSSRWGWPDRAAAWDAEIDRQRRDKFTKAQLEAVERHARATQAALTVATIPVRAVLARLNDPAFQAALDAQTGWPLLRDSWRAIQIMPSLIAAERQALGLSMVEIAVDDQRFERAVADRIVSDPEAVRMAIQLLDQIARTPSAEGKSEV